MTGKQRLFSSEEIIAALVRFGFREGPRKGSSHGIFLREANGRKCRIPIPLHKKEIPRSTFNDILREAGITYDEFLDLAKVKKR